VSSYCKYQFQNKAKTLKISSMILPYATKFQSSSHFLLRLHPCLQYSSALPLPQESHRVTQWGTINPRHGRDKKSERRSHVIAHRWRSVGWKNL